MAQDTQQSEIKPDVKFEKAIFAAGCFWCIEPTYDQMDGVLETIAGYIGGRKKILPMNKSQQERLAIPKHFL